MFSTVPHDLHRVRRAAVSSYFSKQSVIKLEPVIKGAVQTLCSRIEEYRRSRKPLNFSHAFSAFTTDVVTEYCFGISNNFLAHPDFAPDMYDAVTGFVRAAHVTRQFGWILPLMEATPVWLVARMNPLMLGFIEIREVSATKSVPTTVVTSSYFVNHSPHPVLCLGRCLHRYIIRQAGSFWLR